MMNDKDVLRHYLHEMREAVVWKLDGLSERDIRLPMTPTGTNLLGLVKHLAGIEFGYFGEVFGRPVTDPPPWLDSDEDNADMWATARESREWIVGEYRRAWAHTDAVLDELPLDATGLVPWWRPHSRQVTLQRVLVHVIAETARHAGHADIVRELIDGGTGHRRGVSNLPDHEQDWWHDYRQHLQETADRFS